jgi:hypothetical protein
MLRVLGGLAVLGTPTWRVRNAHGEQRWSSTILLHTAGLCNLHPHRGFLCAATRNPIEHIFNITRITLHGAILQVADLGLDRARLFDMALAAYARIQATATITPIHDGVLC